MRVNSRHLGNLGLKLSNERVSSVPSLRRRNSALLGGVCVLAVAFAFGASSANAMNQRKLPEKAAEHASKEPFGDAPKGPVEIIVSIDEQKLHLYSDGQHVADTSVATGVPSLPTPLGFFDVIQKQVFHRSNIYSGAPMPFMQRITWSGVALHEGENIGHRASHGCIRMPHDFAVRLYQFTKLGARVIVADGELKPSEIADPHLFVYKVAPPPSPPAPPAVAAAPAMQQPANEDSKKAEVAETPKPVAPAAAQSSETSAPAAPLEVVKAAQTGDDTKPVEVVEAPKTNSSAATPDKENAPEQSSRIIASDAVKPVTSNDDVRIAAPEVSKAEASKTEPSESAAPKAEASNTDASGNEASKTEAPKPEASKPETAKLDAPFGDPPVPSAASKAAVSAQPSNSANANDIPQNAQPVTAAVQHVEPVPAVVPQPVVNVSVHLASENLRGTDANPTLVVDASNGVVPLPVAKPAAAVVAPPERKTPIAIFVSRKTQRIYVRQNFAPLFDAAITVDHPEQPLGSHVFTALNLLPDGSTFRWDVVSLPAAQPKAKQVEVKDRYGRVIRREPVIEKASGPAPTPQEALARLEIPQDTVDRISAMMVPGSSLIVSDQGLGEETGEGTDFIVTSRN
jgi:hypothetical protein